MQLREATELFHQRKVITLLEYSVSLTTNVIHISTTKRKNRACSSKENGRKIWYKALGVVDVEEKHVDANLSSAV